ncbi:MAG: FliH/SctL family protein [Candidatus Scalindua sp.]
MSKKIIYKLPVVGKPLVLESKIPQKILDFNKDENDDAEKQKELLETVSRESYQKGWDEAVKKMQDETQKNIELICQDLQKAIEDLKQERNTIWDQCEKEIVKLVLVIAKKTVCHEVSKDSGEIIEKVVTEAVNKVKGKKILRLHLSPVDIEDFKRREIAEFINGKEDYEVISDTDISSGGCKLVTDYGSIDARLETRWSEIEAAFGGHKLETDQGE